MHSLSRWDKDRFGALLDELISSTGLSQREIADLADVHHSQVSRWRAGTHRPGFDKVAALGAGVRRKFPQVPDYTSRLLDAAGYTQDLRGFPAAIQREAEAGGAGGNGGH
jgi:transcriptional regulator with XRE-family HTH domain